MFKKFGILSISLFVVLVSVCGAAKAETGEKLVEYCRAAQGSYQSGRCIGFISGAIESYINMVEFTGAQLKKVCLKPDLTNTQARDTLLRFIADNPKEDLSVDASVIVIAAMLRAFPCR